MKFNYVDIGTCDFNAADGEFKDTNSYLFVEPISKYLERLPVGSNIIKANYAITNEDKESFISYIDEEDIYKYSLPSWVKGCNKLGENHPTIVELISSNNLPKTIIRHLPVKCITFKSLIKLYNIDYIEKLKIDTEGHDHIILKSVLLELIEDSIEIDQITFEYLEAFNNIIQLDNLYKFLKGIYPNRIIDRENCIILK